MLLVGLITCKQGPTQNQESVTSLEHDRTPLPTSKETLVNINLDSLTMFLMGRFDPDTHRAFTLVDEKYADRAGLYLQKGTYHSFIAMHEAAKKAGLDIIIRSATRNFWTQKDIWERKWQGKVKLSSGISAAEISDPKERALAILAYSSMPGSSRHHWGTDIDINAFNNRYFETGIGKDIYDWMSVHAASFGFCQPYSEKGLQRPDGYEEEKWHWSYLPIAQELQNQAAQYLVDADVKGFAGADQAPTLNIIEKYVLGINPECVQ